MTIFLIKKKVPITKFFSNNYSLVKYRPRLLDNTKQIFFLTATFQILKNLSVFTVVFSLHNTQDYHRLPTDTQNNKLIIYSSLYS